ncbi:6-phosphogluconate dehydrogenase (decarboxylating) [candidate division WWE3 bacterium CG10_big_fil_rev_8_21_14_0_10_32_10]|uniref:6-phosphogluconate dehydrogenase (Decarboxylating) n=1 Tax=candidate division WWE3 bacterium CG10_big_fil_rev_8_21_14_0_10_32_10 TaxID=1975090 RepID=A0A2H0RB62_UNCKA|nr:MAG: 6-phosphogluconate dehydrogenase (decarboxylating) [candidate division WWE3 bacterium CG10_big_fil_rev_8_21_14_0_10_32_10]
MKKEIGIIGLGKMGKGIALQLLDKGWEVVGYNRSPQKVNELTTYGLKAAYSIQNLVDQLKSPRVIWLMITSGEAVDNQIVELQKFLQKGDTLIDAGNSFYKDSVRRYKMLKGNGINFVDVGISGGPYGARNGACVMVGGDIDSYKNIEGLYKDISVKNGYGYFEGVGAGHFVKMVHNGIEYGMMQSIAEGFNIIKNNSKYKLNLQEVSMLYNKGSVIESKLIDLLNKGFKKYGEDLHDISGKVEHSGEGEWTIQTAKENNLPVTVIEKSLEFRVESSNSPSYIGKILTMMRNMFGGHNING